MLLAAHSGIRYLTLLFGFAAVLYAGFGWATGRPYDKTMRRLAVFFAGSIHLEILIGVAVMFSGRFYSAIYIHFLTMLAAAVVAQLPPSVMRRRPPEQRTYPPHVIATLIALGLIYIGIVGLGRGLFQSTIG
jgi:heme A synthase